MRFRLTFALLSTCAISVHAADFQFIKNNETFCASGGALCIHGSLLYRANPRILSLNARVNKKTGPGTVRIILTGVNAQNMGYFTEISISIRGTYSEIIDHKIRTDAPDVGAWEISSFTFRTEQD